MIPSNNHFKLVVTGSRSMIALSIDFDKIMDRVMSILLYSGRAIHLGEEVTLLLAQGGARGADEHARTWASRQNPERVDCVTYEADWSEGRAAGPKRNKRMLESVEPDMVLAFWDGASKGTGGCLTLAAKQGIPVHIVPLKGDRICR